MPALATLILILFLSLIVVRIATVALTLTGLTRNAAQFQARSAWTGTGFTTKEAEDVVRHPVRRRIVSLLMIARSVGLITAATTLALSFVNVTDSGEGWIRIGLLFSGLFALWLFARSTWIERGLSRVIAWALKRYGDLGERDYGAMLHLAGEYAVAEIEVQPDGWMANQTLGEMKLNEEGVLALGVTRDGVGYIGVPEGQFCAKPRDKILLYGRSSALKTLDRRRSDATGAADRAAAVAEQDQVLQWEQESISDNPNT